MPTGYTAAIADGIDFKTFLWSCAKGMGALIMMRDEPADAPIPEQFQPSDYHLGKVTEARATLAKLEAMSMDRAADCASAAFEEETTSRTEGIAKGNDLRQKYKEMLTQVFAWVPPTPDHQHFKKFMVDQITKSIRFDCDIDYYKRQTPRLLEPAEWLAKEQIKAMKDIAYHSEEYAKEVKRTEERNAWIQALRTSLKPIE